MNFTFPDHRLGVRGCSWKVQAGMAWRWIGREFSHDLLVSFIHRARVLDIDSYHESQGCRYLEPTGDWQQHVRHGGWRMVRTSEVVPEGPQTNTVHAGSDTSASSRATSVASFSSKVGRLGWVSKSSNRSCRWPCYRQVEVMSNVAYAAALCLFVGHIQLLEFSDSPIHCCMMHPAGRRACGLLEDMSFQERDCP